MQSPYRHFPSLAMAIVLAWLAPVWSPAPVAAQTTQSPEQPAQQAPLPYKPPNLNPTGIPSAFIAEWGNYYVATSMYGYDNGETGTSIDGWLGAGVGLGNARRFVAMEIDFNLESLSDTDNGGSLDVRFARQLLSTNSFALQIGAGWLGIASYGDWPKPGGSVYGVLTAAMPLRPNDPTFRQTLQVNLGGGDGRFERVDAVELLSSGVFASVGVELISNLGLSVGWAGKGLNSSLSYVPLRGLPLYLGLSGSNLTNIDQTGRAVALTLSWGGSFRTATFP
jgi:hypothetical protein